MKIIKTLIAGLGSAGLVFLTQIILSHKLNIADFGLYSAINSSIIIISSFSALGIAGLFLFRATTRKNEDSLMTTAMAAITTTSLLGFILTVILFSLKQESQSSTALLSTYIFPFAAQNLITSYYQSEENYTQFSLAQLILPVTRFGACIIVLFINTNIFTVSLLFCAANFTSLAFLFKRLHIEQNFRQTVNFILSRRMEVAKFIKKSLFYSLNSTINIAQIQLSTIVALFLFGPIAAGILAAANTLLTAVYILPNIIFGSYYLPKYHKLNLHSPGSMLPFKHALISTLMGIGYAFIIYFIAPFIVKIIYPASISDSSRLLKILSIAIPFRFYSTAIGAAILSEASVKKKVAVGLLSILLQNTVLFLNSHSGYDILSYSYIIAELFIAIAYSVIFLKKNSLNGGFNYRVLWSKFWRYSYVKKSRD